MGLWTPIQKPAVVVAHNATPAAVTESNFSQIVKGTTIGTGTSESSCVPMTVAKAREEQHQSGNVQ